MSNTFVHNRQLDNGAAITTDTEKLIIEFVLGKPHLLHIKYTLMHIYLQGFGVKIQQNLVWSMHRPLLDPCQMV